MDGPRLFYRPNERLIVRVLDEHRSEVPLSRKLNVLFDVLYRAHGAPVARAAIEKAVWPGFAPSNGLAASMRCLRLAIEPFGLSIVNSAAGYCLAGWPFATDAKGARTAESAAAAHGRVLSAVLEEARATRQLVQELLARIDVLTAAGAQ